MIHSEDPALTPASAVRHPPRRVNSGQALDLRLSHPRIGERETEALLEAMATGELSPAEIAAAHGLSVLQLARIVVTPENMEQLANVVRLHEAQRAIVAERLKLDALKALSGIATDDEVPDDVDACRMLETKRKACVDVLRTGAAGQAPGTCREEPRATRSHAADSKTRPTNGHETTNGHDHERAADPRFRSEAEGLAWLAAIATEDERQHLKDNEVAYRYALQHDLPWAKVFEKPGKLPADCELNRWDGEKSDEPRCSGSGMGAKESDLGNTTRIGDISVAREIENRTGRRPVPPCNGPATGRSKPVACRTESAQVQSVIGNKTRTFRIDVPVRKEKKQANSARTPARSGQRVEDGHPP